MLNNYLFEKFERKWQLKKIKRKNMTIAYRSKVYFKGRRFICCSRKTKKEAELDESNQKREFLKGNYLNETNKSLDGRSS